MEVQIPILSVGRQFHYPKLPYDLALTSVEHYYIQPISQGIDGSIRDVLS
jgi:hypothetical protein